MPPASIPTHQPSKVCKLVIKLKKEKSIILHF